MSDANGLSKRANVARSVVIDGSLVAGFALVSYGCWLACAPAGFIVAGLLLLGLGLGGAKRGAKA